VAYFASMFGDQAKFSFKRKISQFTLMGLSFIFLAAACKPQKAPESVLTEQEMVAILTEIYLAEEKVGRVGIPFDSIKKVFPEFETKIFEKTDVPDSVFRKSMEYYMANPKKLEYIYTVLVDSLNLQAQRAGAKPADDLSK